MQTSPATPLSIAVIRGGVGDPSSTRLLAVDIGRSTTTALPTDAIAAAMRTLAAAAVIAATPVYKAGISGLFKSFIDLTDDDLLIATPVILAATGGSARHAMVPDEQMRPLFAFLRALPVPTSIHAAPADWEDPGLGERIDRAADELVALLAGGAPRAIADRGGKRYRHEFGSTAARADRGPDDIDLDTDLRRLAAGGRVLRP